ncbi:spermidine synthase [Desulfovibrio inopinatus]|uniref:spermidine synthase n=1 Tax=Desulfovibrio inopinatus TaxID=102109 RepID=UPI00040B4573|nr:fused MFS/spermidine synthase [Desulfovibrio inopinatus]
MAVFFSLTMFVSAFLLFFIQPMFGKLVLPLLGGTPAVWNTCMVFYQAALLLGYVYAHVSLNVFGPARQSVVHLFLLAIAMATMPIGLSESFSSPPSEGYFIPWLFGLMTMSVGIPFFLVSSTAPMLQRWFSATGHVDSHDPYFLYGASNLGSMIALLGYPVFMEPFFTLSEQTRLWSAGFMVLAGCITGCVFILHRALSQGGHDTTGELLDAARQKRHALDEAVSTGRRLHWLALSFVPSSLLLGVTNYITTDIAAVPLLWIVPLTLYLLTFVLVFAKKSLISPRFMVLLQPFLLLPLALIYFQGFITTWWLFPVHIIAFFVTTMVCHQELARLRPHASRLTEFYLVMSIGGVLGGIFNALIAPVVFDTLAEYPLMLVAACFLRPTVDTSGDATRQRLIDVLAPVLFVIAVGILLFGSHVVFSDTEPAVIAGKIINGVGALVVFAFRNRPVRFGLGVAGIFLAGMAIASGQLDVVHEERNFFGELSVIAQARPGETRPAYYTLYDGSTLHGAERIAPQDKERRCEPLSYYHRQGPLAEVFAAFNAQPRHDTIAAIGLGIGSLVSYLEPEQQLTFFEINPAVVRMAQNTAYFHFLSDCGPQVDIKLGDARLTLADSPDHSFDMLVLDAFSSDSIPVHLITKEALELYLKKTKVHGIVVFHISNQFLDLRPVLGNLADQAGLFGLYQDKPVTRELDEDLKLRSTWAVMAHEQADITALAENPQWHRLPVDHKKRLWTDDYSNILGVMRFR